MLSGYVEAVSAMRDVLTAGWPAADPALLHAAVGHAVAFATWYSLAIEQGLTDERAARLMQLLVVTTAQEPATTIG